LICQLSKHRKQRIQKAGTISQKPKAIFKGSRALKLGAGILENWQLVFVLVLLIIYKFGEMEKETDRNMNRQVGEQKR